MNYLLITLLLLGNTVLSNKESVNKSTVQNMILVEGGTIKYNKKKVSLNSYYIDKHEVTLAQFSEFVTTTGYKTHPELTDGCNYYDKTEWKWKKSKDVNWRHDGTGRERNLKTEGDLPVANITVKDAKAYAKWAGKRLPTVQEWIYAASGGKQSKGFVYSGSNSINEVAWYDGNSEEKAHPVMTKAPNELGIFDMSGNIQEFVLVPTEKDKVHVRGGAFVLEPEWNRVKDPNWEDVPLDLAKHEFGFRCVKDVE